MSQEQKDFDSWVQKLANSAERPFHEESWMKMEKLLDRQKKRRTLGWLWLSGMGLIFSVVVYLAIHFIVRENITITKETPGPVTKFSISKINQKSILATAQKVFDEPAYLSKSEIQTTRQIEPGIHKNVAVYTGVPTKSMRSKIILLHLEGTVRPPDKKVSVSDKIDLSNVLGPNHLGDNSKLADSFKETPDESIKRDFLNSSLIPSSYIDLSKKRPLDLPEIALTIRKINPESLHSMLFSVYGSPEFSRINIRSRTFDRAGKGIGFTVGYRMGHWSLMTGLQATKKIYHGQGADYETPTSDYLWGKYIHRINAECSVLEWPLLIGYQFKVFDKTYFQLDAGITSLRMNTERYAYEYSAYGKINHLVKNYATKNWNLWSAATVRVSYQRPVAKHLTISFSPYLNIPLKGIGYGQVSLRSVGSQVGLTYSLPVDLKK